MLIKGTRTVALLMLGLATTTQTYASLLFNGANSVAVLDGSYLDGGTHANYTFDLWIRPNALGGTLIGKTEYWQEWTLDMTANGGLMFRGAWPYNYWGTEVGQGSLEVGSWQNIACAVDNGQASFYVNGSLVGVEAVQDPISFRADASIGMSPSYGVNGVMMIGYTDSGTTPDYNFFNGAIYGIRVWDRTLSAGEVNSLATSGVIPTSGLVNAVMLDENTGSTIHDELTALTGRNLTAQWTSDMPLIPEPHAVSLMGIALVGWYARNRANPIPS